MPQDPNQDSKLAYEPPLPERPATASPTEQELEREMPGGIESAGHDPYAALRLRDYRLFTGGWLISVIGQQVQGAAISWEIWQRTGSGLALGYIGLAYIIPTLLLALPAGQLADFIDRRRIVLVSTLLAGICSLGLAALSYYEGPLLLMYGLLMLTAAFLTIGRPARAALLPQIVPSKVFPNAVTWNQSLFQLASVGGPALGGAVILLSIPLAYAMAAAGGVIFCTFLLMVHRPYAAAEKELPSLTGLWAGVRFVVENKIILATLTLDLFAVLLGSVTILLPIFAERLEAGAVGYGWMRAAPAIGAFAMALTLAHLPPMQRAGRALVWSVAGFGAATVVFGFSTSFWLSLAMLCVTGALDNVSVVVRHTLVQLLTPDAMRGRVSSVNQIFIGSSNELGGLRAGVMAHLLGPVLSVVLGGIGTIAVVAAVAGRWPQVRRFGRLDEARPEPPPRAFAVIQKERAAPAGPPALRR